MNVCCDWLEAVESENILKCVITCDQSRLFEYNPETKHQSIQWIGEGEARPKKAWMSKSQVKTMSVVFFDKKGMIHKEFLPQKTIMNAELYLNILHCLCKQIHRVWPELLANNSWLFHLNNAPMYSTFKIRGFFSKNQVNVLDHLPYSPDFAPCDFLFQKIKIPSKVIVFKAWRIFKKIWLPHLKALRKKSSVCASSNGNIAQRSAFSLG